MKILKWIGSTLVVLIAVVVVVLVFFGGQTINEGVNRMGPQVLGVPVVLEDARFSPLQGHVSLSGLIVGNPEGFRTDSLFDLEHIEIDINLRSLFTDTIIIERILIRSPQITYEVGLRRTNLGALLAQLEGDIDEDEEELEVVEEQDVAKTVIIKELVIEGARAQVSATAMRGQVVPIQLATIRLTELGGPDQSVTQITTQVIRAVLGAVGNAVADAGDLLGDGLKAALGGVGAVGGAAVDGARAVTGAVGGGARAVGGILTGRRGEADEADSEAVAQVEELVDAEVEEETEDADEEDPESDEEDTDEPEEKPDPVD